jgi:dipeptidyl aminopeptidase/acylaminoacyl peptidase
MAMPAATGPASLVATAAEVSAPPLIERSKLCGNPSRIAGRVSPDGKWLSWIAPEEGVLNIWLAPRSDLTKAHAVTSEKTRPIREYFWAPDSRSILFINDQGGDENFQLYSVNVADRKQRSLTPFDKTRVQLVGLSKHIKSRILSGVNQRDPRWHDVYSLDLDTGKLTEVLKNSGDFADFVADDDLKLRLAIKSRADGGNDFFHVRGGTVEEKPFSSVGLEDSQTTTPMGYTGDGKLLYWLDSRGRDTAALVAQDVASGASRVIAESTKADLGSLLTDPCTGKVQAYEVEYLKSEWSGKSYISAGDLQWGAKMHDDLIDAVNWAVANRITTADKVAIMGGSYEGYATLAGLAFTPDTFACGVDIVGPSNLATLLKTIPPYWEAAKVQFYKRMGDPTTDEGRTLLHERSPLFRADAIKKPLLIGQGANDPRVNQAESDQIVTAMEARKIPVTYLSFPDEGHGFARPENSIAFNAVAEQFLGQCLGGRVEPVGDTLKSSTLTVPHGAELVPSLKQAVDAP